MSDEITPNIQTPQTEPEIESFDESQDILPISEPIQAPETQTAQIPVNEPLAEPKNPELEIESVPTENSEQTPPVSVSNSYEAKPEELPSSASLPEEKPLVSSNSGTSESKTSEPETIKSELEKEISETKPEPKTETKSDPEPEQQKITPIITSTRSRARELLIKARNAIQSRKRKKLDRVLSLFAKQTKITNDEVEKLLHVSDATATRYLSQLEKEGKIKQNGKTGSGVFYTKI